MRELHEFNREERERINAAYSSGFDSLSPEDVALIIEWEQAKASEQAKAELQAQYYDALTAESLENARAVSEQAKETLAAIERAALERLERVAANDPD